MDRVKNITLLFSQGSDHQKILFNRAAEGLRSKGVEVAVRPSVCYPGTKAVACWGWRRGIILRQSGHDVLVFERAYLGDRFKWTSLAWNGLNGRGDFRLPKKLDPHRFRDNFEPLKPWSKDGRHIVIMGQVPGDMSLQGRNLTPIYEEAAKKLEAKYQKPVFFRPHPHGKVNFEPRLPIMTLDFEEALSEAFLVFAYNSNTGVDAVVRGIPAVSMDKGSMAWAVTSHGLDDTIKRPDRKAWANKLAHCQWTPEEIERGDYWERFA